MITIKKIFSKPSKTSHKLNVGKFSTELLTIDGLTKEQQIKIHEVFYNIVI